MGWRDIQEDEFRLTPWPARVFVSFYAVPTLVVGISMMIQSGMAVGMLLGGAAIALAAGAVLTRVWMLGMLVSPSTVTVRTFRRTTSIELRELESIALRSSWWDSQSMVLQLTSGQSIVTGLAPNATFEFARASFRRRVESLARRLVGPTAVVATVVPTTDQVQRKELWIAVYGLALAAAAIGLSFLGEGATHVVALGLAVGVGAVVFRKRIARWDRSSRR